MIGNVQLDNRWLGNNYDVSLMNVDDPEVEARWRTYAAACRANSTPAIVQLCHPGRQSPITAGTRGLRDKTIAPSAIPLNLGDNLLVRAVLALVFGTPREMTTEEVEELIGRFASAAKFLSEVGFDGVELHGAHGYLLSLFMSAKVHLGILHVHQTTNLILVQSTQGHIRRSSSCRHIHSPGHPCCGTSQVCD